MVLLWRALSPVGFALVAVLFALPFGALRYEDRADGETLARAAQTWHGVDLVIGGSARVHLEEKLWDETQHRYVLQDVTAAPELQVFVGRRLRVPAQPAAVGAALLVLAGLVVELSTVRRFWMVVSTLLAFTAVGALVLGHWLVTLDLQHRYHFQPSVTSRPAYGFWLASGVLLVLGGVNALVARFASGPTPGQAAPSGSPEDRH